MGGVQEVMLDMKRIRQARVGRAGGDPPLTRRAADALPGDLRPDVNEAFLMHGTNAGVLINILSTGMNERFAGTAAGAAYGEGLYLAEDAGKNDQYTKVDPQYDGSTSTPSTRATVGRWRECEWADGVSKEDREHAAWVRDDTRSQRCLGARR